MRPTRTWLFAAVAGALAAALALLAFAPASLADVALRAVSNGRVALTEADGSIWNGSGRLVFVDVASVEAAEAAGTPVLPGVAVPGRLSWKLRKLPLVLGLVDAQVQLVGMSDTVRLSGHVGELRVDAGRLALPSVDLGRLGSPWNTIRPAGSLELRWDGLVFRENGFEGKAEIDLRGMASALTPVRPLGDYRIEVSGDGGRAALVIQTLQGPLRLAGKGTWDARAGVRFEAEASADESEKQRLDAFLGMIGRRVGDRTIIKIGA